MLLLECICMYCYNYIKLLNICPSCDIDIYTEKISIVEIE